MSGAFVPTLPPPPELSSAGELWGWHSKGVQRQQAPGEGQTLQAQRDGPRWVQGGPCPHRAGRERESEQREAELDVLLPSLQLRQTPRALQNDEGIKPLFYLILRLRI